jgi:hypothetical protein
MKLIWLTLVFISLEKFCIAQTVFVYDASGNRINTIRVAADQCNTCPSKNIAYKAPVTDGGTYQWQVDTGSGYKAIVDDSVFSGSKSGTLVLVSPPKAWYGYKFRCQVTNGNATTYSPESVLKFFTKWKGTVNNAWEIIDNWSCKELPDEYTDVIVENVKPVVLTSNAKVRTITFNAATHLTVKPTYVLEVKK